MDLLWLPASAAAARPRLSPARLAHPLILLAAGCVRPLDHPAVRAPFLEAGLETGHVVDAVLRVGLEAALLATEAEFFVFELSLSDARLIMILLIGFLALPASVFKEVDCVCLPFSELLHLIQHVLFLF